MKHHGFHKTEIHHLDDGSHTVHHHHVEPHKSVHHAAADLDEVHDSLEHHMGEPNEGEAEMAPPMPAAAPPPAPPPAMP